MIYQLLISTCYRNNDSAALSTKVVDYETERDAEQVYYQINSAFSSSSDYQKIKVEAIRLYPYKGK